MALFKTSEIVQVILLFITRPNVNGRNLTVQIHNRGSKAESLNINLLTTNK